MCIVQVEGGCKSFIIDDLHAVRMIMRAHPVDVYTDVLTEDDNMAIKVELSPTDVSFENAKTGSGFRVGLPPFLSVYPGLKRAEADSNRGVGAPTISNAYDYLTGVKKSAEEDPGELVKQHEELTGIMTVIERTMPKEEQTS